MLPLAQHYQAEFQRLYAQLCEGHAWHQYHMQQLRTLRPAVQHRHSRRITASWRRLVIATVEQHHLWQLYAKHDAQHPNEPPCQGPSLWQAIEDELLARQLQELREGRQVVG